MIQKTVNLLITSSHSGFTSDAFGISFDGPLTWTPFAPAFAAIIDGGFLLPVSGPSVVLIEPVMLAPRSILPPLL